MYQGEQGGADPPNAFTWRTQVRTRKWIFHLLLVVVVVVVLFAMKKKRKFHIDQVKSRTVEIEIQTSITPQWIKFFSPFSSICFRLCLYASRSLISNRFSLSLLRTWLNTNRNPIVSVIMSLMLCVLPKIVWECPWQGLCSGSNPRGGGALRIMDYAGRLHPKGYRFSFLKCIKSYEFHELRSRADRTESALQNLRLPYSSLFT